MEPPLVQYNDVDFFTNPMNPSDQAWVVALGEETATFFCLPALLLSKVGFCTRVVP